MGFSQTGGKPKQRDGAGANVVLAQRRIRMKEGGSKKVSGLKSGFYQEIDSLRLKSSCSLWAVISALVMVFLLALGALILARANKLNIDFNGGLPTVKIPRLERPKDFKVQTVAKKDGIVTIILTEEELGTLLGIKEAGFPLKKASLKILPEKIVVSGKVSESIFALKVDCSFSLEVRDQRIYLKIGEVRSGKITAPKAIIDTLSTKFDSGTSVPDKYGITLREIKLHQGYAELIGETR